MSLLRQHQLDVTTDVPSMERAIPGFHDWIDDWSSVHDGFEAVNVADLHDEDDLPTEKVLAFQRWFVQTYPGRDRVLVYLE